MAESPFYAKFKKISLLLLASAFLVASLVNANHSKLILFKFIHIIDFEELLPEEENINVTQEHETPVKKEEEFDIVPDLYNASPNKPNLEEFKFYFKNNKNNEEVKLVGTLGKYS